VNGKYIIKLRTSIGKNGVPLLLPIHLEHVLQQEHSEKREMNRRQTVDRPKFNRSREPHTTGIQLQLSVLHILAHI